MFTLNEKVVYPGHGVAKINRIVEKKVGDSITRFFELEFLNKDMTILVPMHGLTSVGIRRLSSNDSINEIFRLLSEPANKIPYELTASNWNKRNKEYQGKIRTGNIGEICKIYRDLKNIAIYKELSFGEKNLLNQTEGLLVEEIALVTQVNHDQAVEHLRSLLFKNVNNNAMAMPIKARATVATV
ncbi:MAG TPA: CarD family transcriptional regulator [Candidatus Limnocylindria bacterium]|nr:CarD family transcriptional regulator [Candidatus Limnocylindria bacterium]